MIGNVTSQGPVLQAQNVTAVQTGTYAASVGDVVMYDSSAVKPRIDLPAITAANKGGRVLITSADASNVHGVDTIPSGTDTVVGFHAIDVPGFVDPMFAIELVSNGVVPNGNWAIANTGTF